MKQTYVAAHFIKAIFFLSPCARVCAVLAGSRWARTIHLFLSLLLAKQILLWRYAVCVCVWTNGTSKALKHNQHTSSLPIFCPFRPCPGGPRPPRRPSRY